MNEIAAWRWTPVLLLVCSNLFMTIAWYGHLRFKTVPLWQVILVSWGIALFEYLLMVPANRWGHTHYSAIQLKIMQEVITLSVFSVFVIAYLGERIRWNHLVAFLCIVLAVFFAFLPDELHAKRPMDSKLSPGSAGSTGSNF